MINMAKSKEDFDVLADQAGFGAQILVRVNGVDYSYAGVSDINEAESCIKLIVKAIGNTLREKGVNIP